MLADFLEERSDPRAESIRIACQLERLERDDPARKALEKRLEGLPQFSYFVTPPPGQGGWGGRRRGFVDQVNVSVEQFAAHGEALVRAAPITCLDVLFGIWRKGAILARCPALASLRTLKIPPVFDGEDVAALASSPHLVSLRELVLENCRLDLAMLACFTGPRHFPGLRELRLWRATVQPDVWAPLRRFCEQRALTALDFGASCDAPADELAALRALFGDGFLPQPRKVGVRFGKLDLSGLQLDDGNLVGWIEKGPYPDVKELILCRNPLGDLGLTALAESGAFPSLITLRLGGTRVSSPTILALSSTRGLEQLEILDLGKLEVMPHELVAFANSPALPALRRIEFEREWRPYTEGAREEVETETVTRDDGRVVEIVTGHWIFP